MDMPFETLALVAVIGAAVGWFAHTMSEGTGLGILGDTVAGLVGAFAAALAAPKLGIAPGDSALTVMVVALIGAVIVPVGARYLAGVWESQRRTDDTPDRDSADRDTAHRDSADRDMADRRSAPQARERAVERDTSGGSDTTGLWPGVAARSPRPRGALRAEPGSQLWFRKS